MSSNYMKVSGERILSTLARLAEFGPRWMGSPAAARTCEHISAQFSAAGLALELQPFTYLAFDRGQARVWVNGEKMACETLGYSSSTSEPLLAPLVYVGGATEEELAALKRGGVDLAGAVALSDNMRSFVGYPAVEAAGAAGFILATNLDSDVIRCGSARLDRRVGSIPGVSLGGRDARRLIARLRRGEPLEVVIETDCRTHEEEGHNVVGLTPGRQGAKIIISAHYDSFWDGVHAVDNLAGVATVLQLARTLPRTVNAPLEFVAFGGEELGCWGAAGYVAQREPMARKVKAMVNLDAFGSEISLVEIGVTADLKELCERVAAEQSAVVDHWSIPPRNASDQQLFMEEGIPVVWLSNFGSDPRYHTPLDTVDIMSAEKVEKVADLAAGIVEELGRDQC